MNRVTKVMESKNMESETVCCNAFAPSSLAMLAESLKTKNPAIIEQAWMCFTEFSPDYW